ncbi:hypothetical protein KBC99_00280 [Candidatus Saccharibacteria bacterium]|nr:hypothetical protein [Candidatus Saccharibacteria bacterium]
MSEEKEKLSTEPILEDKLGLDEPQEFVTPEAEKLTDGLEKPKKVDLRPWYKRPKVWGITAGAIIVLAVSAAFYFGWRNRQVWSDYTSDQWRTLKVSSEQVASIADKATYQTANDLSKSLREMESVADSSLVLSRKNSLWMVDGSEVSLWREMLEDTKAYSKTAREQTDNLASASDESLAALKDDAVGLQLKTEAVRKKIAILEGGWSDKFFDLHTRLGDIVKSYRNLTDAEQAKADLAKSQLESERQNKAAAEAAVAGWTQAYIAGNANAMKTEMTSAFTAEYDFSQVTASYRTYNYPVSFRLVSTDKKGEQYEIIEVVTFVSKSDYSPESRYTVTYNLLISQNQDSKKWLVNSLRYQ